MTKTLDVICMGRAAVDFYGQQLGGRLEDMQSFAKYLGGSSANLAAGLARLGVRCSMLTRVGDEHMGRFVREALASEGVDVSHVVTDPKRLTALVVLGISSKDSFPHIFFRENCADLGIKSEDFDQAYIASSRSLAITGTHLSTPQSNEAMLEAVRHARNNDTKVILDIDYRPVLWGLVAPGGGEERFVASDEVTGRIRKLLPDCELVVGTEEEIRIAGGDDSTMGSLRNVRSQSGAVIVVKRGPTGCSVFDGPIPAGIEDGITVKGVGVEVFNVVGAGDAFLSGFLYGWLDGASWSDCGALGNACGALVVSRHGCTPAMPTKVELDSFMKRSASIERPDRDHEINYLHRVSTRRAAPDELFVLAFDHRKQLEEIVSAAESMKEDICRFKSIVCDAVELVSQRNRAGANLGIIVDERYGEAVLSRMTNKQWWIGRPVEIPGSCPVQFDPRNNMGLPLNNWPKSHIVKCLVYYHPDDPLELRLEQEELVCQLHADCVALDRELLLEVISSSRKQTSDDSTVANVIRRFYNLGVYPAWWKLESQTAAAWDEIEDVINNQDPYCNGVLLLGLDAPEDKLAESFRVAAPKSICKGFAVGRSIFGDVARKWFAGKLNDEEAANKIAKKYERIIRIWQEAAGCARTESAQSKVG
ncbi:MAG: 5-dehydro-2-deoxygluconokinase [Gammaproteobacteria bacterium]